VTKGEPKPPKPKSGQSYKLNDTTKTKSGRGPEPLNTKGGQ